MQIDILHQNIYGIGGTVRSVVNLANALGDRHHVRIISLFRRVDEPKLRISPRVRVVPLVDVRPNGPDRGHPLHNQRSQEIPPAEELFNQYSRLTDERLRSYLDYTRAHVVVGTRPGLNLMIANTQRARFVSMVQEHTTITNLDESVVAAMSSAYQGIDVVTTVSAADRMRVIESVGVPEDKVFILPNGIPEPQSKRGPSETRTIVAAGRLSDVKRYDLLLRAFAVVAEEFPEWRLRVYGDGHLSGALKQLSHSLGVAQSVDFMGPSNNMAEEWAKGDISVCSSDYESFGMTIIESLRCAVPVVSTACPDGPIELLESGRGGLLVLPGDHEALAKGILSLLQDPQERRRLAALGAEYGAEFDPARIAERFESLVGQATRTLPRLARARGAISRALHTSRWSRDLPAGTSAPDRPTAGVRSLSSSTIEIEVAGTSLHSIELVARGGGRFMAELPVGQTTTVIDGALLREGIWNLRANTASSNRSAGVRPLWIDSHRSSFTIPPADIGPFIRAIPYSTVADVVGLRVWNRPSHVEVTCVRAVGTTFEVQYKLYGDHSTLAGAEIEARRTSGIGRFVLGSIDARGGSGTLEIPAHTVAERRITRQEAWSLYAVKGNFSTPLATLDTDIPDLRRIRVLPTIDLQEPLHEAHPYGRDLQDIEVAARYGPENILQLVTRES